MLLKTRFIVEDSFKEWKQRFENNKEYCIIGDYGNGVSDHKTWYFIGFTGINNELMCFEDIHKIKTCFHLFDLQYVNETTLKIKN